MTEVAENTITRQPKYGVVEGSGVGWDEESVESFYVEEEMPERRRAHRIYFSPESSSSRT
jgi:hypothetical protein